MIHHASAGHSASSWDADVDADVRAFDVVYEHILAMADALSDGIIKQFPAKFAAR